AGVNYVLVDLGLVGVARRPVVDLHADAGVGRRDTILVALETRVDPGALLETGPVVGRGTLDQPAAAVDVADPPGVAVAVAGAARGVAGRAARDGERTRAREDRKRYQARSRHDRLPPEWSCSSMNTRGIAKVRTVSCTIRR